jgi:tetratricopeptide (TPR) repeat protein
MSVALLSLVGLFAGAMSQTPCSDTEVRALILAQEQVARGDDVAARQQLETPGSVCALQRIASLALRGWADARALAARGGAVELQGPVRQTLDALAELSDQKDWGLEIEYAATLIRAAIAAAQDERPEMELLLTHARDLSERLLQRNRRPQWPRPFNVAAGDLWFEVDRYADAVAAYERAIRGDTSPVALVGLARALARLDRMDEACATYRRASDASERLRATATPDLVRCP